MHELTDRMLRFSLELDIDPEECHQIFNCLPKFLLTYYSLESSKPIILLSINKIFCELLKYVEENYASLLSLILHVFIPLIPFIHSYQTCCSWKFLLSSAKYDKLFAISCLLGHKCFMHDYIYKDKLQTLGIEDVVLHDLIEFRNDRNIDFSVVNRQLIPFRNYICLGYNEIRNYLENVENILDSNN